MKPATRSRLARAIFLACIAPLGTALAMTGEPLGPEQPLHASPAEQSIGATVAFTPEGRRLRTYNHQSGDNYSVKVLLTQAPGWLTDTPQPLEWTANQLPDPALPALAVSKYGYSLVAWPRQRADSTSINLTGRMFGPGGSPFADEFQINQAAADQIDGVAAASDLYGGRYLVAWRSHQGTARSVRARLYGSDGAPIGNELLISNSVSYIDPIDVVMAPPGSEYLGYVVWLGHLLAAPTYEATVLARPILMDGSLGQTVELAAQTIADGVVTNHSSPAIAASPSGELLLTWARSVRQTTSQTVSQTVVSQVFDRHLAATGNPVEVSETLTEQSSSYSTIDVASIATGGFAAIWKREYSLSSDGDLMLQGLDAHGVPTSEPQIVADAGVGLHVMGRVAADADGDLSVVWSNLPVGGGWQVLERRYRGEGQVDLRLGMSELPSSLQPGQVVPLVLEVHNDSSPQTETYLIEGARAATGTRVELTAIGADFAPPQVGGGWRCEEVSGSLACEYLGVLPTLLSTPPLELNLVAAQAGASVQLNSQLHADQDDPNLDNNQLSLASMVIDAEPEPFQFQATLNVSLDTLIESESVSIDGINTAIAVSVQNGEYSLNGAAFTSTPGSVRNGDTLRVRHRSSNAFSQTISTTLTVGEVSADFTSTTEAIDATPDPFAMAPATDVALGIAVTSQPFSVTGINAPTPIQVNGGSFSINGAAFTEQAGLVRAGDVVSVRHTSSSTPSTQTTSTLTIGGVSAAFTSTTEPADGNPDPFDFLDVTNARRGSVVYSNPITISGVNVPTAIGVSGGASYSINNGTYTSVNGIVRSGDIIRLRTAASSKPMTSASSTVTIGGGSDRWTVTTGKK